MAEKDPKDTTNASGEEQNVENKPGENKPAEKKKRFSPEDQEFVDEIVNEVFARGINKGKEEVRAELTGEINTLKSEIAELKKPKTPAQKKQDDADGTTAKEAAELKKLQAQLEELKSGYDTIKSERDTLKQTVEGSTAAARTAKFETNFNQGVEESGITFFNTRQVFKDVSDVLRQNEDGSITVMNPKTGQPRLNAEMEPFTLSDFLAEYARKNPHMVRTEVDGGTGSEQTKRHATRSEPKSVVNMSKEEFEAFHQKVLSGAAR